jgi:hypothetical protein
VRARISTAPPPKTLRDYERLLTAAGAKFPAHGKLMPAQIVDMYKRKRFLATVAGPPPPIAYRPPDYGMNERRAPRRPPVSPDAPEAEMTTTEGPIAADADVTGPAQGFEVGMHTFVREERTATELEELPGGAGGAEQNIWPGWREPFKRAVHYDPAERAKREDRSKSKDNKRPWKLEAPPPPDVVGGSVRALYFPNVPLPRTSWLHVNTERIVVNDIRDSEHFIDEMDKRHSSAMRVKIHVAAVAGEMHPNYLRAVFPNGRGARVSKRHRAAGAVALLPLWHDPNVSVGDLEAEFGVKRDRLYNLLGPRPKTAVDANPESLDSLTFWP